MNVLNRLTTMKKYNNYQCYFNIALAGLQVFFGLLTIYYDFWR